MIKSEITLGADKNPALFLARLTEAVQKYITTPAGLLYLHVQFISQSTPDIGRKLRQLEKGPETPQRDLLEVAFKVFNNREEEAKREKEHERKAKYAFLVAAIKGRDQPGPSHPRTRFKTRPSAPDPASDATSSGHRAKACPHPRSPQKHAQPMANGDTGRWTVCRDALATLGKSPLLPRTPAQPYESCSNDGAQVPAPRPVSQT